MTCPICNGPTVKMYRPFCSKRCADLDLGRWITGAYAIPSEEPLDDEADHSRSDAEPPGRQH